MDREQQLQWASDEADRLSGVAQQSQTPTASVETAPAREFLCRVAPGSVFCELADANFQRSSTACRVVAGQLQNWIRSVNEGIAALVPFEVRARVEAATDLMEQVEMLLADSSVTPAAPVVLTGAALEELLRSMWLGTTEPLTGKPCISTYATALRRAGHLNRQDEKDITAWAGLRNGAAHGEFADIDQQRAQNMADGVNLFMRQKSDAGT